MSGLKRANDRNKCTELTKLMPKPKSQSTQ